MTPAESLALDSFTDYMVRNYPGPNTIISDPAWHAPRIFRAALHALSSANAATLKAAQGGVTEAMVDGPALLQIARNVGLREVMFNVSAERATPLLQAFFAAALEAALSAEPAAPCSLNEAMEVIEVWADHGGQVHGEAAARLRALADRIAPEPAAQGDVGPVVAWMTKAGRVINTETRERVLADAELGGEYIAAAKAAEAYCIPLYTATPAQPAERVPEGWMLVPIKPTQAMIDAMEACEYPLNAWDEALAASPAPSEGGKGVEP